MMKKVLLILGFSSCIYAPSSQLNVDFQTRFGPNSPVYNEPLYFSTKKTIKEQRAPNPIHNYRTKLRKSSEKKPKPYKRTKKNRTTLKLS